MRINARLDEEHRERLEFLTRATGASVSEVLKRALDLYYERESARSGAPGELLRRSGFIGVAEGESELSERYKQAAADALDAKHGDR